MQQWWERLMSEIRSYCVHLNIAIERSDKQNSTGGELDRQGKVWHSHSGSQRVPLVLYNWRAVTVVFLEQQWTLERASFLMYPITLHSTRCITRSHRHHWLRSPKCYERTRTWGTGEVDVDWSWNQVLSCVNFVNHNGMVDCADGPWKTLNYHPKVFPPCVSNILGHGGD